MPDIWQLATIAAKLLLYVGALGATGLLIVCVAFGDVVAPVAARIRLQAFVLSTLTLAASMLSFLLRGAMLTGGADGMTDPEILSLLWETPVGDALVLRAFGAGLLIVGHCIARKGQWIALVGGMLVLWSFTQIGHVTNLAQNGARLPLLLHLLGIAFWIGILPPLHDLTRTPGTLGVAAQLGQRFGQAAMIIVPALMLAGLLIGWMIIGRVADLVTTGYGLVLLLKVALVTVVLALAAVNKLRFVPSMQKGDPKAARDLRRSIQLEAIIFLLILTATATLTSLLSLPG